MRKVKHEDSPTYAVNKDELPKSVAAALEVIKAHIENTPQSRGKQLGGTQDAMHYFLAMGLREEQSEVFGVMFLDTRHRMIAFEKMFRGTIDQSAVYPREVVKRALELNASAIILTHNHPSGDAEPSASDISLTERIVMACGLVEIRVLDHIVVGDAKPVSLAERDLM